MGSAGAKVKVNSGVGGTQDGRAMAGAAEIDRAVSASLAPSADAATMPLAQPALVEADPSTPSASLEPSDGGDARPAPRSAETGDSSDRQLPGRPPKAIRVLILAVLLWVVFHTTSGKVADISAGFEERRVVDVIISAAAIVIAMIVETPHWLRWTAQFIEDFRANLLYLLAMFTRVLSWLTRPMLGLARWLRRAAALVDRWLRFLGFR